MERYVYKDDNSESNVAPDDLRELEDEEFRGVIAGLIGDAANYIDEHVAPSRELATAFYRGDPRGDEEIGRSTITMTVVRDIIQSMMPSLLRTFAGSEHAVEFLPSSEEEVELAQQQTDAVNFYFNTKNDGFTILYDAIKDALIRKVGVITWGAHSETTLKAFVLNGMTKEYIDLFEKEDGVEIVSVEEEEPEDIATAEQADPHQPGVNPALLNAITGGVPAIPDALKTYTVRYNQITKTKKIWAAAIPPEELIISRNARSECDALLIGRTREITIGDLVKMGYDYDEVRENAGSGGTFSVRSTNTEALTRNPALELSSQGESGDPSMIRVQYTEVFVRIDRDGDGIPELRRVCTLGDAHYILHDEVWEDSEPPYALLCPDPEPHMAIGYSIADQTLDLQSLETSVVRNTMDSLANAIHPRTAVVESQVNIDDVLNTEVGAVIRMRQAGAIQELTKPFLGQEALGVLAYLDQVKARRTGITDGSQGLNGDEMQSTSAIGISAQLSASQERLELIARIFAEGGLKRLFKGLLRTIIRHTDGPIIIRTRDGKMPKVDPSIWNADADVAVNIGLGKGSAAQKAQTLMQVLAMQKDAITQFGLQQPVVGVPEIRNTVEDMLNAVGIKNAARYFKAVPPGWAPPEDPNKNVDPNQVLMMQAQAAMMKAQSDARRAELEHEREMIKLAQDREIRMAEIEAKYSAQINEVEIRAHIDRERMIQDAMLNPPQPAQPQMPPEGPM